jgi:hypothetical protein
MKTVFVIMMENHSWGTIKASKSAGYINTLAMQGAHAENYNTPAGNHPSEPNYIWLEAGNNLGITTDDDPSTTHLLKGANHLVKLMNAKGITWREYAEGITTGTCPVKSNLLYACKHVPFVFFDDIVTATPSTTAPACTPHMKNYTDIHADLVTGDVAQYNFITPNLVDDMHNDGIAPGDKWLKAELPNILNSQVYKDGGAVFITWDESEGNCPSPNANGDCPIGMLVLSPFAKGGGYHNSILYYHSSMLRTVEDVFGLTPLLNDAANQANLSDLFSTFP